VADFETETSINYRILLVAETLNLALNPPFFIHAVSTSILNKLLWILEI